MVRRSGALASAVIAVALILIVLALVGCSSDPDGGDPETTTSASIATTTVPTQSSTTTTSLELTLTELDKELAKTAKTSRDLLAYLSEEQAATDDPRFAIIYGLRARTQAITGRQALDQDAMELADSAMRDVYQTLNRGKAIAAGTPAQILEQGHAAVKDLGVPSDDPERAATMLDDFISAMSPMLDEATKLTP